MSSLEDAPFPVCSSLYLSSLLRIVSSTVFMLVSVAANVCMEVKRREVFLKWWLIQRTAETNRGNAHTGGKSLVSGLDRLQAICKEVSAAFALEQCKQRVDDVALNAQITYASELVGESLELLTRCPNIYATYMDKKLRDKSYIQGYQIELPKAITRGISMHFRQDHRSLQSRSQSCFTDRTVTSEAGSFIRGQRSLTTTWPMDVPAPCHLDLQTNHVLVEVGYALLKPLVEGWSCEELVLRNFLWRTEQYYQDNPYHNAVHGAMVAFMMTRMLNELKVFSDSSHVVALTAARLASLCHDVGHPARNNAFLTSSSHLASIIYNDSSILENFHAALTFRILSSGSCNIFERTSPEFYRSVRGLVIDLILATDMKSHFDFLTRLRNRKNSPEFNVSQSAEDQYLITEGCIRAADISHGLVNWDEHFEWSMRVTLEFYLQGDEEKRLGLPISPLCDRDQANQLPESQVGFLTYVVMPLLVELQPPDDHNTFMSSLLSILTANTSKWGSLRGKEVEKPASFTEFEQNLRGKHITLDLLVLTRENLDVEKPVPSGKPVD
ncbi:UNVERIFIED_CONTAM: 3',5'-cyclic-nucleotide phosphodiesterase, putative [Hammondia hammondi]|eukprot:XP_008884782.1 3',5'-cyclic-nucleotide phosphodiesterase, putative [Hammondia hammondi]